MATHRRIPQPGRSGQGRTWAGRSPLISAAATAAVAIGVAPAAADPAADAGTERTGASERVDELFAEAERAVEAYNGTSERVDELREDVERRQDRLARSQQRVNQQRHQLGSVAAAHYRSGGIDPTLALMLSQDPDRYLDQAAFLQRVASRQTDDLHGLQSAHRAMEQQRAEAALSLAELERHKSTLAEQKRTVRAKLAAAQRELNRLSTQEREERERAARSSGRDGDPGQSVQTMAATADAAPSGRASSAINAARQAVGRPYVWGQNGPTGFDCSGLTQWAYAQAGTALPRTSQGQAGAGRQVGLDQAQPGDLVIYRSDASHVAIYAGGGQVIHAPYPGAAVRYDPVGMMPVSSVVRP